ncbi:unnamed protein product, partial [Iphiclides podalirius]
MTDVSGVPRGLPSLHSIIAGANSKFNLRKLRIIAVTNGLRGRRGRGRRDEVRSLNVREPARAQGRSVHSPASRRTPLEPGGRRV